MRAFFLCLVAVTMLSLTSCTQTQRAMQDGRAENSPAKRMCDEVQAQDVLDSGADLAEVEAANGTSTWHIDPESWPPIMSNPQAFVRKVAAANACVHHPAWHIVIRDPDGKFLGETGPEGTHIN